MSTIFKIYYKSEFITNPVKTKLKQIRLKAKKTIKLVKNDY